MGHWILCSGLCATVPIYKKDIYINAEKRVKYKFVSENFVFKHFNLVSDSAILQNRFAYLSS